jgi:hypothetical protein
MRRIALGCISLSGSLAISPKIADRAAADSETKTSATSIHAQIFVPRLLICFAARTSLCRNRFVFSLPAAGICIAYGHSAFSQGHVLWSSSRCGVCRPKPIGFWIGATDIQGVSDVNGRGCPSIDDKTTKNPYLPRLFGLEGMCLDLEVVARDGIEPPTPAFSGPRSTTELSGLGMARRIRDSQEKPGREQEESTRRKHRGFNRPLKYSNPRASRQTAPRYAYLSILQVAPGRILHVLFLLPSLAFAPYNSPFSLPVDRRRTSALARTLSPFARPGRKDLKGRRKRQSRCR